MPDFASGGRRRNRSLASHNLIVPLRPGMSEAAKVCAARKDKELLIIPMMNGSKLVAYKVE